MKKNFLALGLMMAATLTLTNCTKEDTPASQASSEFIATLPAETKTEIDGLKTIWKEGDQLNVVYGAAGATTEFTNCGKFTYVSENSFTGTIEGLSEGSSYDWYAVYPYASKFVSPLNESTCYMTVGSQSQSQNGLDDMAHISGYRVPLYGYAAAQTYTGSAPSVPMKHLSSLVKVHITNNESSAIDVISVKLTTPGHKITGTWYVSFVGGDVTYLSSGDSYTHENVTTTVTAPNTIAAGASADVYMSICPVTIAAGEEITVDIVTADEKQCSKTINPAAEVKFNAGKIKTLNVPFVAQTAVTYNTIAEVLSACSSVTVGNTSDESFNVKDAVVMAADGRNYIISDGTANILYYGASSGLAVAGDVVTVTGKVKNYYGTLEFAADITITKTDTTTPSYPTPTTLDSSLLTEYASAVSCMYVTVSGSLSGGYITVDGAAGKVRVYNASSYKSLDGKTVEATGYVYGWNTSNSYAQMIAVEMEGTGSGDEGEGEGEGGGESTWSRVTSVSTLLSGGTFIIGYEAEANSGIIVPMQNTGTATASAAGYLYTGTSSTSSSTMNMSETLSDTGIYELSIVASTVVDGAICIKVGELFIGNTNTKNNLKFFNKEATTTAFTPTIGENDVFTLSIDANAEYKTLQYNSTSPRFAVYKASQKNPVIYKKN